MKNLFIYLVIALVFPGCEKGEIFTGSPADTKIEVKNLTAVISSTELNVVGAQRFPVTVTLPQKFDVDVNVELTSEVPNSNKRIKRIFTIPANTLTFDILMTAVGADNGDVLPFQLSMKTFVSGINTTDPNNYGFKGVIYTISSNTLEFGYGDSSIVAASADRCSVRLDWLGPHNTPGVPVNNLNIIFKFNNVLRPITGQNTQPIFGAVAGSSRYETINFNAAAADGTYTIDLWALKLTVGAGVATNLPYRFTVRFPNESVKTFVGVLNNITETTLSNPQAVNKLTIVKSTNSLGKPEFLITQ